MYDEPVAYVHESEIKCFVNDFMDGTKLGSGTMNERDWQDEIKRFTEVFPIDLITREHSVTELKLLNFINEIVVHQVNKVCMEFVRDGIAELYWDSDSNDFAVKIIKGDV